MSLSKQDRIYVAGHRGMVGSAIVRRLQAEGYNQLILRTSSELDLRHQQEVENFFDEQQPDVVIDAAARVGGILANDEYPYTFLYDNLQMQNNIIHAAHNQDVERLVFLGSSCIYPKHADQPLKEEYLLTGPLEPTNQWYAVAKIAGVKMCEALRRQYDRQYLALMPTNLFGPGDNFDLQTSHVLPALIRKYHQAKTEGKTVTLWGTGSPKREFLHVDDLARAVLHMLRLENPDHVLYNVGTGKDLSIKELSELIKEVIAPDTEVETEWDTTKPDGTPRKLLDIGRIEATGWQPQISLREGIEETYDWFLEHGEEIREVKIK
ncbi:MAG: GDP-L-fucose synthase family protein [Bacteroidota bacterium]